MVKVQTQKAENLESESELGSGSDTKRGNAGVRVRTWIRFRHKKGKCWSQSPNLDQVQTQKGEMLESESELGSGPDTKRGNAGVRARTWINFRQKKQKTRI
ncbi:hypothetical protein KIS4809_3104 [Bacillus sp. ZZV12-4809]|nr:hypothetical protein KIS4809_3104 [Bacillus sp. ZZV12-4809]